MMTELSLNVLDIANNSIRADADLIEIEVRIHRNVDTLTIRITDNGNGMNEEQLLKVEDPFYTTRTTRGVGLGVPFFKQGAEMTGGSFIIESEPGVKTVVTAEYKLSHIDRMPLGDINSTIYTLIIANTKINFIYTYELDGTEFVLDTRNIRDMLGEVPLNAPEVAAFIKDYLNENKKEVDGGYII